MYFPDLFIIWRPVSICSMIATLAPGGSNLRPGSQNFIILVKFGNWLGLSLGNVATSCLSDQDSFALCTWHLFLNKFSQISPAAGPLARTLSDTWATKCLNLIDNSNNFHPALDMATWVLVNKTSTIPGNEATPANLRMMFKFHLSQDFFLSLVETGYFSLMCLP